MCLSVMTLTVADSVCCLSDPEAYGQLMLCMSDKHEDTPAINAAILAQQDRDNVGTFNILQPR